MNESASAFSLLFAPYLPAPFLARDDCVPVLFRAVWLLLLAPPELLLPELLLADTLLRVRAAPVLLLAVFVAPLTLWLLEPELVAREPVDRVVAARDPVLLDAEAVLPVFDLTPADLPLVDLPPVDLEVILPAVLLIVLLAVFPVVLPEVLLPEVLLEADEVERLFFITLSSLSPLPPIFCMAAPSLPNSSAM